jgi:hypothetical protein
MSSFEAAKQEHLQVATIAPLPAASVRQQLPGHAHSGLDQDPEERCRQRSGPGRRGGGRHQPTSLTGRRIRSAPGCGSGFGTPPRGATPEAAIVP